MVFFSPSLVVAVCMLLGGLYKPSQNQIVEALIILYQKTPSLRVASILISNLLVLYLECGNPSGVLGLLELIKW